MHRSQAGKTLISELQITISNRTDISDENFPMSNKILNGHDDWTDQILRSVILLICIETYAMGGRHEKGAISPRFPPLRVSRAPRPFVLNSGEKSVCFEGYFIFKIPGQNPMMSPLQVNPLR